MSSETKTLQQLYEDERLRALKLEKKYASLETELEKEKARLRAVSDSLADLEAVSELRDQSKDQQLQAKDATIQELRTALDNAGRSPVPAIVETPVNVSARQKDLKSASKAAQPISAFGLTRSKSSFDPAATPCVPQPSKTMAEVAAAPSQFGHSMTGEGSAKSPWDRHLTVDLFSIDWDEVKSKVPDKKRKRDATEE